MDPIFTVIIIILALLAILDLIVGVANDAVNFLNSALGAKVAPMKVILGVAAVGILLGVVTSNGMMEVARKGVFYPEMFTFTEVMMLFAGVMLTDVILLNTFNSLGLPTSTTVSLIFELLGSAVAVTVFKVANDSALTMADVGQFINSGKALVMISGILVSVAISFIVGSVLMYFSRMLFSFRYERSFGRYGAMWCGVSICGILYFAIFKGMKSSGLFPADLLQTINDNIFLVLGVAWVASSLILLLLQKLKVNILKTTILSGTFALALAFAGNDLVNFIGVPIAGIDAYNLALNSGNEQMLMSEMAKPAQVNPLLLITAGVIMTLTLFFSRSAMRVAQTQLSLSSQNTEDEKFGSTLFSRTLVRFAIAANATYKKMIPASVSAKIERRFEMLPEAERGNVAYDNVRAVVNLAAAAILICIGTSFKLPLSTTYVVFMVAMGSSLADRAWGRDSAVYRITGVMVVISGWFMTAIAGFVLSFAIATSLVWGGWIALIIVVLLCGYALCHNLIFKSKKSDDNATSIIDESAGAEDALYSCTKSACRLMEELSAIYNHMLVALFTENRKVLKETVAQSEAIYRETTRYKYGMMGTLKKLHEQNVETAHYYVQVVDYLNETAKALLHITRPAYEHINTNPKGLSEEQIHDLKIINDEVENIFNAVNDMLREKDFSKLNDVLTMRDRLFDTIAECIKNQIRRLKTQEGSTKASALFMNILSETKVIVLHSRNLLKSEAYFLNKIHQAQESALQE